MAHSLNVEIFPSSNTKILTITDTSLWDCDTAIDNLILEVKPPGRGYFSKVPVVKEFVARLNCTHLEMCCVDCDNCVDNYTDLPDGVYSIKLSYNPNLKTMVEFRHLRNTAQMAKYINAICELRNSKCEMTRRTYKEKEQQLFHIKMNMDVARYQVEECGNQNEGMDLYEDINDMLDNFIKSCSC